MLAGMHPSSMYALAQLRMAEAQELARDGRRAPRWRGLRMRLHRSDARRAAARPVAAPAKPAV
jgi:hypothetical protein